MRNPVCKTQRKISKRIRNCICKTQRKTATLPEGFELTVCQTNAKEMFPDFVWETQRKSSDFLFVNTQMEKPKKRKATIVMR